MTNTDHLLEALIQEQSIFKKFSLWRKLGDHMTAFYATDTDLVPHWNLVYPTQTRYQFSLTDLEIISEFYNSVGRIPHIMTFTESEELAVEKVSYFVLDQNHNNLIPTDGCDPESCFVARNNVNMNDFSRVIGEVFELDQATQDFFLAKMSLMAKVEGSQFWIVYRNDRPVGTASTFRTENGGQFLFNVAIDKDVQKQGLGRSMLSTVVRESRSTLYTYSHNPAMINVILPELGFTYLGSANVVPVHRAVSNL